MQIIISGKGVDLTDAIEGYITKKVNGLDRFFTGIIRADITVGEDIKRHHKGNLFFAEGKLEIPGNDVFVRKEAQSLYEAIDDMKDHLERELKKHKLKLRGGKKKKLTARANKEYHAE